MNDQRRGRLNMVRHLLKLLPDHEVKPEPIDFPPLSQAPDVEHYSVEVDRVANFY
jgi:hypothetical protein